MEDLRQGISRCVTSLVVDAVAVLLMAFDDFFACRRHESKKRRGAFARCTRTSKLIEVRLAPLLLNSARPPSKMHTTLSFFKLD